jgi:AP-4 complex subunit beta-1
MTSKASTPAERKGEVNDLRTQLRDPLTEKDPARRRDLLKKVVAFMTIGVDTSALFSEMILACITKDLVAKKMIYFYLCVHSETNSEIAILSINTLQKDCKDESPLVRGLALRSLASLRLPHLTEYLIPTLKACLLDTAPYVRKTAILATLKLFRISPESFRQMNLTEKMYGMLRDNDALVSMNALAVLQEVTEDTGGIVVNKSILYFLLNRLRDVAEWQQILVLDLVLKYTPASEDEMFDIMNLLEERLRGSNSAVIISCSRVFLYLTQNLPAVHRQVFDRLKEPLLTLMSTSGNVETSYALLCHIKLLAQREPKVFAPNIKDFYCRHTELTYIKAVKMEIMTMIATEQTAIDAISELTVYASDVNNEVAKLAIVCMGRIALRIDSSAKTVLDNFLEFMTLDMEHVRAQTLVVMKDFLRKHSDIKVVRPFLDTLVKIYRDMHFTDDESKVALVWVLGEFGEHIEDAPYLIESLTANLMTESYGMRIEILTTGMKLFFKRPPEMQPVLATIFRLLINDFSHADVHDRALLYYRLLRNNVRAAAQVVCAPKESVQNFLEDDNSDVRDKLFEEFNSMSVIYNLPSVAFIRKGAGDGEGEDEEEEEEEDTDDEDEGQSGLLALELSEDAAIEPPEFQRKWSKLETSSTFPIKFKALPKTSDIEDAMEKCNIMTMASGAQGGATKFYLFAQQEGESSHFLVEMVVQSSSATGSVTVKSDDRRVGDFTTVFKKVLTAFC